MCELLWRFLLVNNDAICEEVNWYMVVAFASDAAKLLRYYAEVSIDECSSLGLALISCLIICNLLCTCSLSQDYGIITREV